MSRGPDCFCSKNWQCRKVGQGLWATKAFIINLDHSITLLHPSPSFHWFAISARPLPRTRDSSVERKLDKKRHFGAGYGGGRRKGGQNGAGSARAARCTGGAAGVRALPAVGCRLGHSTRYAPCASGAVGCGWDARSNSRSGSGGTFSTVGVKRKTGRVEHVEHVD